MAFLSALLPPSVFLDREELVDATLLDSKTVAWWGVLAISLGIAIATIADLCLKSSLSCYTEHTAIAHAVIGVSAFRLFVWPVDKQYAEISMHEMPTRNQQYMLLATCGYYAARVSVATKKKQALHVLHHVLSTILVLERLTHAPSQLFLTCLKVTVFTIPDGFAGAAHLLRHRVRPVQVALGPHLLFPVTWREVPESVAEMPRPRSSEWITISFGGLSLSVLLASLALYSFVLLRVIGEPLLLWLSLTHVAREHSYSMLADPRILVTLGVHAVSAIFCWQATHALLRRVAEASRLEQLARPKQQLEWSLHRAASPLSTALGKCR